jgi:hypothetical protein
VPHSAFVQLMNSLDRKKTEQSPVPPGQGKEQTHSRNQRRRKLRQAKAERRAQSANTTLTTSQTLVLPVPLNLATSLSVETSSLPYDMPSPPETTIATSFPAITGLKNSNKKRGFQKSMQHSSAQRTTFESTDRPQPRLVPPSERTDLPSNVFVTKVNCQDGEWSAKMWDLDEGNYELKEREVTLVKPAGQEYQAWKMVEQKWNSLPPVTSEVEAGALVAWEVRNYPFVPYCQESHLVGAVRPLESTLKR